MYTHFTIGGCVYDRFPAVLGKILGHLGPAHDAGSTRRRPIISDDEDFFQNVVKVIKLRNIH
jgi:hypothetical protein